MNTHPTTRLLSMLLAMGTMVSPSTSIAGLIPDEDLPTLAYQIGEKAHFYHRKDGIEICVSHKTEHTFLQQLITGYLINKGHMVEAEQASQETPPDILFVLNVDLQRSIICRRTSQRKYIIELI
jgi:hypothetical protein